MALELKKEWPVVPATANFDKLPAEWPAKEHEAFDLTNGPSENHPMTFIRASRLRTYLWFSFSPFGYTEAASTPKEVLRRSALGQSKNLWYLPEQSVVRDPSEKLFHRTEVLTVKGVNNGLRGVGYTGRNPAVWLPSIAIGAVWAYRWASTGTN